jgi:hypothetical protein
VTVYVRRNGKLVNKASLQKPPTDMRENMFPTPMISRFESFESPVTGKDVTSWRQRDQEMREHDCYDPRDLSPDHVYRRGRDVQLKELEEVRANDTGRTDDADA